jgi:hypothetical protein
VPVGAGAWLVGWPHFVQKGFPEIIGAPHFVQKLPAIICLFVLPMPINN